MVRNYFKIALRNMSRNKFFIFINVMGLALSMTCAILIFTTIKYHLSFDNFHSESDRIYRIVTDMQRPEGFAYNKSVPNPLGKAFRTDYTFAEKVARIATFDNELITMKKGNELVKLKDDVAFAEPDFFEIFNYPLLRGDKKLALSEPNTAILTERVAKKYFGDENPINKILILENRVPVKITGLLKDLPANTERQTGIYASFVTLKTFNSWYFSDDSWGGIDDAMQCFVRLKPNVNIPLVENLMFGYVKKFRPASKNVHHYKFQKLEDVHFDGRYSGPMEKGNLMILGILGLFLIITACVNFINLATAQALKRSKEVGIRKVLGSRKKDLFWQFISETAIVSALGIVMAYGFAYLLLPYVNSFFQTQMSVDILTNWQLVLFMVALSAAVTFLAGSYPGLVLSGFRPVIALKGKISQQQIGGFNIRRTLIITQLSISMFLIIGMLVIVQQLKYVRNADLGFNKDAVVMLPIGNDSTGTIMKTLKNELNGISGIDKVSLCYAAPASSDAWNNSIKFDHQSEEANFRVSIKSADDQYIPLFDLELVAGRNLFPSDTVKEFVVNEAFVRKAGLKTPEQALGKFIAANAGSITGPIVGVVKDFHDQSFHQDIAAVAITSYRDIYSNYAIKINSGNMKKTLAAIERAWS